MVLAWFLSQRLSPPSVHSEKLDSWRACEGLYRCTHTLVSCTFPLISPTFVFAPMRQVFVSCNFCGKSISYSCSPMPHQGRGFSQYGVSGSPTKSKVTSCPGCRKPLPRCALCLMNMGTPVSNCPGKPDARCCGWAADSWQEVHILKCILFPLKGLGSRTRRWTWRERTNWPSLTTGSPGATSADTAATLATCSAGSGGKCRCFPPSSSSACFLTVCVSNSTSDVHSKYCTTVDLL